PECDIVELLQQAEACELAHGVRKRVAADADFAAGIGLLGSLAANAARAQHQCRGETTNTATDDNRLHRPNSTQYTQAMGLTSHGRSLRRKRLCRLRLELGPGLGLSL